MQMGSGLSKAVSSTLVRSTGCPFGKEEKEEAY
jgi:hypothetical protein